MQQDHMSLDEKHVRVFSAYNNIVEAIEQLDRVYGDNDVRDYGLYAVLDALRSADKRLAGWMKANA